MTKTFSKCNNYLSEVSLDDKFYEITFKLEIPIFYTPVTSLRSYLTRDTGNPVDYVAQHILFHINQQK